MRSIRAFAIFGIALLLASCATLDAFQSPGVYPIKNGQGKVVAQIQTVVVKPEDIPPRADLRNLVWWLECGGSKSSFKAPLINNGLPYLPTIHDQLARDFLWWLRNPGCNFVGFIIGFEGQTFKVTGNAPTVVTLRDINKHGYTWSFINEWAPFVSFSGKRVEFYFGWRPTSGGFGAKFVVHATP